MKFFFSFTSLLTSSFQFTILAQEYKNCVFFLNQSCVNTCHIEIECNEMPKLCELLNILIEYS